jgi:hypothetical protein
VNVDIAGGSHERISRYADFGSLPGRAQAVTPLPAKCGPRRGHLSVRALTSPTIVRNGRVSICRLEALVSKAAPHVVVVGWVVTSKSAAHRHSVIGAEILAGAAVKPHQLDCILMPEIPTANIVAVSSRPLEPPLSSSSQEPPLAKAIKGRLSRTVHVRIG